MSARPTDDLLASLSVAISPSENRRHLVRYLKPDEPFFYLGDTAWELPHRLTIAEAEVFLRNRAAKGFNAVMVVLFAEHGGLDYPNRAGDWPFHPSPDSKEGSYLPDLTRPDPAYFEFIDKLLPLAASMGISIGLTPTWGRYINGGYYGAPVLFNKDNAYAFGKFVGERYPFHPYILGGDSVRYWNEGAMDHLRAGKSPDDLEIVDFGAITEAMAKGLIEGEGIAKKALLDAGHEEVKGYDSMITFHSSQVWFPSAPEATASAQFPDSPWLSFDVVQTGHHDGYPKKPVTEEKEDLSDAQASGGNMPKWLSTSSYIPVRKMYDARDKQGRPRPVMDLEAHYENTHHWFDYEKPLWTARDIRSGAWQAIFAGACGYTYGCNSIWQMHNADSTSHPPIKPPRPLFVMYSCSPEDRAEPHIDNSLRKLVPRTGSSRGLPSLPPPQNHAFPPIFYSRVPDQSFILSDTNEPKDGSAAGDKLISGMRSKGWAMVHLPYGGSVEVDLIKAGMEGKWRGWWIDPKTGGREVTERGNAGEEVKKSFKAPSEGSLDDDWLLLIEEDIWNL